MAKIDRSKYFEGGNFLKAEDVKNGQSFTIEKFEEASTQLGIRPILRLKGQDKPFGLNATNLDKLVEKFGDEADKWAGKRIQFTKTRANNPQTHKEVDALRIV
jgi:hypothetical protein